MAGAELAVGGAISGQVVLSARRHKAEPATKLASAMALASVPAFRFLSDYPLMDSYLGV